MAAYQLEELIQMWAADKITQEQAIGQILLQVQSLSERIGKLERRLEEERRTKKNG